MEKVFVIGMFKTGTTSIAHALQKLGKRESHFELKDGTRCSTIEYTPLFGIDPLNPTNIPAAMTQHPEWSLLLDAAEKATVFKDAPWLYLYKQWDRLFPNSKFILTLRKGGANAAALSDLKMWKRLDIYKEVRQKLSENEILCGMKLRYEMHVEEVRRYFLGRHDHFLEICIEDQSGQKTWEILTKFVMGPNAVPPSEPFPRSNVAPPEDQEERQEFP